jgi:hypothetical protein
MGAHRDAALQLEAEARNWRDARWLWVFQQDFESLHEIRQGMTSQAFVASRANPIAEGTNVTMHDHVRRYVVGKDAWSIVQLMALVLPPSTRTSAPVM